MIREQDRILNIALLIVFAVVATLMLQYIGRETIYQPRLEESRLEFHNLLLQNRLPEGVAFNTTNIRLFTVLLADRLSKLTGISLHITYIAIDTVCLFTIIILLYGFLRKWFSRVYGAIGVLYFTTVLPLTYLFHYYHPWDRISLVVWIVMLYFLREKQILAFSLMLSLSVIIKLDSLFVPLLYFLYFVTRSNWQRTALNTIGLFVLTFGIHYSLRYFIPGGFKEQSIEVVISQIIKNWDNILKTFFFLHPVFLVFAIPVALFILYHKNMDRFVLAAALFGCSLFIPFYLFSNFNEIRAHMPVMVLILPAGLMGLHALLEGPKQPTR